MNTLFNFLQSLFNSDLSENSISKNKNDFLYELFEQGNSDVAEMYVKLRIIEKISKELSKEVAEFLIIQAAEENRRFWRLDNRVISIQERMVYDFSNDELWLHLNKQLQDIKENIKRHSTFLKNAGEKNDGTILYYPPAKKYFRIQKPGAEKKPFLKFYMNSRKS